MLRGTPFHTRTAPLNQAQAWRRWAGYLAAGAYELSHEREYWAVRNSAALFDISPLYKYLITGPDAARLLNRVVTRDVTKCAVGQVLYTPWCDAAGKVLDDGTLARLDEQAFRLTAADPNLRWLHQNAAGLKVEIKDVSDTTAALALQGPRSREILQQASPADLAQLKYFRLTRTTVRDVPVTLSRTGYTGDLGYELWTEAAHAERLWDALIAAGRPFGITPAGILALDVARVEAGLLLLEVDYQSARHALIEAQKSTPYELGLGWAVALDKGSFVGRAALAAEQARGPNWQFVGLDVEWETLERLYAAEGLPPPLPAVPQRTSVPVAALGRQVGYLVMVEVTIQHQRRYTPARVVPLPFFNPERKKA